jgi:hypothetical protein
VAWLLSLLGKGPKYRYRKYKVNGSRLADILRTADFDRLNFKPSDDEAGPNVRVKLEVSARKKNGSVINTGGLMTPYSTPLKLGELDYSNVHNYFIYRDEPIQMQDLLAIYDRNGSGMFFILEPVDGVEFDSKILDGYLCYKIMPFKENGDPADVDFSYKRQFFQSQHPDSLQRDASPNFLTDFLSLQLNPCPPGSKPR